MQFQIEKKRLDAAVPEFDVRDLEALDRDGLIAIWSGLAGDTPPRAMSQILMRRFLSFELQARTSGGLHAADLDRLASLAESRTRAATSKMAPGARFLREWNGVTHVVERTDAGYRWSGRIFGSLSGIAKEITGAHWSGPRFFGVVASAKAGKATIPPTRRSGRKGAST